MQLSGVGDVGSKRGALKLLRTHCGREPPRKVNHVFTGFPVDCGGLDSGA